MADHRVGEHAPRSPQGGERHLDREQRGLHDVDLLEARLAFGRGQLVQEGPPHLVADRLVAGLQGVPEGRLRLLEAARHPQPLRPLPGEDEHDLRALVRLRAPADRPGPELALHEAFEAQEHIAAESRDDGEAVFLVAAPDARGVAKVVQGGTILGGDEIPVGAGARDERLGRVRREKEDVVSSIA